ncbi:UDP binding domain-containing protein, partial [Klebsiella pneumoniae]|nr:UDP binding domain-containing protein [Klebsiella pneumoniae]
QGIAYADDPYACARDADALAILTPWDQFRALDLAVIGDQLRQRVLVDFHNIYRPDEAERLGYHYVGVGRPQGQRETTGEAVLEAAE